MTDQVPVEKAWPEWLSSLDAALPAALAGIAAVHGRLVTSVAKGYDYEHLLNAQLNEVTDRIVADGKLRTDVPPISDGSGSRNYLWSPGTFSNDINVSKTFPIKERLGLELRASFFNPFNQVRRQDLNTTFTFKMKGKTLADGYYLNNSPEQNVTNLLKQKPGANAAEQYNQYRNGVGHETLTNVMDMRRIEIGLRLKF